MPWEDLKTTLAA
ncbi:unnamed protein product, partial [Rotaria magnacalcarata]